MLENLILAEKYRPKTIEECILPVAIKKPLLEMIETGNVSHCLLSGSPGTGKTTAVRALVNQLNGELLFINASLENGIDVIRTKVMQYSSTVSLEDKPKFLLFDEFDGLSRNAMESLRGVIEEFKNVRFFFTCNHKNRVIDAIISRTTSLDFVIPSAEQPKLAAQFFKRVLFILEQEKIEYDKKVVVSLVNKFFPDFRRTLNEIQRYATGGAIDAGILVNHSEESLSELIGYLKTKNFKEMRKWVGQNSDVEPQVIFRNLYDRASDLLVPDCIPNLIITLADYSFKSTHSVDQEILLAAAMTEIMASASWK